MPRFIDSDGNQCELDIPLDYLLQNQDVMGYVDWEGKTYRRDKAAEIASIDPILPETQIPKLGLTRAYEKPLVSQSLGCHPSQAAEFNKSAAPGVHYNSDGTCSLETRQARRAEMKNRGFVDHDAGYGDAF